MNTDTEAIIARPIEVFFCFFPFVVSLVVWKEILFQ